MSWCNWCDVSLCPNWDWNREIVDEIIESNLSNVDLDNSDEVRKATKEIIKSVVEKNIKPCWACLQVKQFIDDKRNNIIQIVNI